tara:strand:- start:1556 stop:2836 length:1281 start_codon:yes stop_codon:yes gene_type:complete
MAFLGGLFGDIKTSDVLVGAAKRGAEILKDEREEANETVSRMADYQIKKNYEEQERFQTELRENLEKINAIKGYVGGSLDGAEYIVRTYGVDAGVEEAKNLQVLMDNGMQPKFLNEGNQNTINNLAYTVTQQPAIFKTGTRKQGGILGAIGLGRDLGAEAQGIVDRSTQELAFDAPDLGAIPTMGGVDRTDFGMLADSKDEAQRQLRLAIAAEERGDEEASKKHKDKMQQHINIHNLINGSSSKGLTPSGVQSSANALGRIVGETSGLSVTYKQEGNNILLKFEGENVENQHRLAIAQNTLTQIYDRALRNGISAGDAYTEIANIAIQNQLPSVKDDGVGGFTITGSGKLIEEGFIGGMGAFAPPIPPPSANGDGNNNNNDLTLQEIEEKLTDPTLSMADRQTLEIEKEELLKQQNTGSGQMGRNN